MKEMSEKQAAIGQANFQFFNEIGIINQLVSNRAERVLPHGLTMSQFSVLNHFARGLPSSSPLELANAFQVTKGAMTNTLKQLQTKGFVDIIANEADKRAKIVSISSKGEQAHLDAREQLRLGFQDFMQAIDPELIQGMLPALQSVRIWLDEHRS